MIGIYQDGTEWQYQSFIRFPKKVNRLCKAVEILCQQMGEDSGSLLIHHMLKSIQTHLLNTLKNQDYCLVPETHVIPEYIPEETRYWEKALTMDFFTLN
jgi:hypothetical protein